MVTGEAVMDTKVETTMVVAADAEITTMKAAAAATDAGTTTIKEVAAAETGTTMTRAAAEDVDDTMIKEAAVGDVGTMMTKVAEVEAGASENATRTHTPHRLSRCPITSVPARDVTGRVTSPVCARDASHHCSLYFKAFTAGLSVIARGFV